MCFLEEWVINVLIPMTNKEHSKKMDLQEFYVFLGCIFFMACHNGVPDWEMWWSTKPIDMFGGAPFWLNAYMSRKCFNGTLTRKQPSFFLDCLPTKLAVSK